jgi:hypothetical protein
MAILISTNSPTGWEFTPRAFFSAAFIGVLAIGSILTFSLILNWKRRKK